MLKLLFYIAAFYLVSRTLMRFFLIAGTRAKHPEPENKWRFTGRGKKDFNRIEDADYEDLTDNEE